MNRFKLIRRPNSITPQARGWPQYQSFSLPNHVWPWLAMVWPWRLTMMRNQLLIMVLCQQGHPTTVSSWMHWKVAIQSTFRCLEMYSKWCCKICICSVTLGELEAFPNYKGYSIIFPKTLDAIERFTKVRIFLVPLSITFLNPKILGFLFLRKLA